MLSFIVDMGSGFRRDQVERTGQERGKKDHKKRRINFGETEVDRLGCQITHLKWKVLGRSFLNVLFPVGNNFVEGILDCHYTFHLVQFYCAHRDFVWKKIMIGATPCVLLFILLASSTHCFHRRAHIFWVN